MPELFVNVNEHGEGEGGGLSDNNHSYEFSFVCLFVFVCLVCVVCLFVFWTSVGTNCHGISPTSSILCHLSGCRAIYVHFPRLRKNL